MNIDIQVLIQAAKAGGATIKEYFGQILETQTKHDSSDYRTKADVESEEKILGIIEKAYPEANINSEERGIIDKNSEYTIVVDPLDGTNNFVLGIPYVSCCIGVLKNNEIIAGVIHNPILNQTYYATRGHGAWLDGQRLKVNQEAHLGCATVSYIQGYKQKVEVESAVFARLHEAGVKRVTVFWSVGLDFCLLASGRIEAIIHNRSEIYDYAHAKLIAREAGAKITDLSGQAETDDLNPRFIASNGTAVHDRLLQLVDGVIRD